MITKDRAVADLLHLAQRRRELDDALRQVKAEQHTAVVTAVWAGLSQREISDLSGLARDTVSRWLHAESEGK
jgi:DNA-directed RNA polymerase specialized sigma24 family protein